MGVKGNCLICFIGWVELLVGSRSDLVIVEVVLERLLAYALEQIPQVIVHRQISDLPTGFGELHDLSNQAFASFPIGMLEGIVEH